MDTLINYEEQLINILTDKGAIIDGVAISNEELSNNLDLLNSLTPNELNYLNILIDKHSIEKLYKETKDWDKVFKTYVTKTDGEEAFVDAVGEFYKVKVKDAKHLKELTGITQVKKLERTLIRARYFKYMRTLEGAIKQRANYKELLEINPKDFGLPESWRGCLSSDQYSSILWVISWEYLIDSPLELIQRANLKSIAKDIQAPYSVLMDCYNLIKEKD